jgi:Uma2 family endonuclease
MGMPNTARRYTVDEVLAFPNDGNRYELVDGELLVTPAPSYQHQRVVIRLCGWIEPYLQRHPGIAELNISPADISWDREKLVQPDLFVVPAGEVTTSWASIRTLLLAVEVVSPSSARGDRLTKRMLYQRQGVATYWVVDPDARLVDVWHPADHRPEIVTDALTWRVTPEAEELVIALDDLFRDLPEET